jgi:hypothetical protein
MAAPRPVAGDTVTAIRAAGDSAMPGQDERRGARTTCITALQHQVSPAGPAKDSTLSFPEIFFQLKPQQKLSAKMKKKSRQELWNGPNIRSIISDDFSCLLPQTLELKESSASTRHKERETLVTVHRA